MHDDSSTNNGSLERSKSQTLPPQDWDELRECLALYKQLGLRVIPMKYGEKTTYLEHWKPYQQRAPTLEEEASWFNEGKESNVGIICGGASQGLVTLCFNTKDGAETFYGDIWEQVRKQAIVVGTKRGPHVYLRSDKPIKSEIIAWQGVGSWLEIRGDGNYIIAPPSLHPSGIKYRFLSECHTIMKVTDLDDFITKRLKELGISRERDAQVKAGESWVTEALKGVGHGIRDVTCTRLAGYFKNSLSMGVTTSILKDWATRCEQPPVAPTSFTDADVEKCVTSVYQYGEPIEEPEEEQVQPLLVTPELPEDVWQGLFRDYRDLVAGTTEAPDNYHYVCFAQTLGATLARRTHVYHARRLFPNFYICLVGRTAITRKDTARYRAQRLLNDLHSEENPEDPQFQILPGIGSAEGLLDALGGERKVVVLSESELLSLLAKARQEALSNLIPKLTSLFDCPDLETLKTRQRTVVCKEPFLSISSGTTLAWLQRALTEKDIYGGFANRFIFVYGNPKKPMPFPPKMDPAAYTALLTKINEMRLWAERLQRSEAGGELTVPDTTRSMFADFYAEYHKRCAAETLPATLIPRVQTFVWKYGLLYAAMAASEQILPEHLEPAIIAGNYFEQSVLQIFRTFGASRGKEVEDKLLAFLQSKDRGTPIPQREVYRALNLSAAELEQAAKPLERLGLIRNSTRVTEKGRKVLCYEAL
ncbi:MAG: bifunctional DNA primase/polymerase [Dehalococcoidia bacterium]|nr:bifunctional DNA primase/polymerase [Dehalococcoidia bacterium]